MLFARDFLADQRVFRAAAAPESPAVSVVLPTWRRHQGGLLRRAVESVLAQSFGDLELIAVDDGSTDGSHEYLLAVQAADPRLVYVRHELNSGLPALRVNEGIELARGRFIAFQFDDDEWLEGALAALVERAWSLAEPAVVFGSAVLVMPGGEEQVLPNIPNVPGIEVNLLTLSYQNRIANNSVLIPRELLDLCGLYDCHVGMRRFCDWDLWIRLARRAPFVPVERRVSRAHVATDSGSIGASVLSDLPLFRYLNAIPRDPLLAPSRWRDYEVDALRVGEVEVVKDLRRRLQEEHVRPFHRKLLHAFPHLEPPPAHSVPAVRSVLYTMDSYYGSFELCMGHYDLPVHRRGLAKSHYQPLFQIGPCWGRDVDLLLLVRTVMEAGGRVAREAAAAGIPTGYYLDDDLLHLYEHGPPFDVLAPGTPRHANLLDQLSRVDAVWVTNPVIAEAIRPHNPRIVPHNGSVPEEWLAAGLPPRGRPVRIGYVGGGYRLDEFRTIWAALERLSAELGDELIFELWGLDASSLPPLASPVVERPFSHGYQEFIDRLVRARFDVLLTPLLDHPRPRLAKSPSKYYHAAVAGALGIFSDVPPYAMLPHGLTCLKAANDPESWYLAMREAVTMPAERFDLLRRRTVEHVRLEYTERAQIHLHEAAVRATEFHAAIRARRGADGRPRVRHLVPGAEEIAREYGVEMGEEGLVIAEPPPAWVGREVFARGLRRVLEGAEIGKGTDLMLDASGSEEIPAGLREALAGGVLVVSNSPGVRELLTDGVTGLLFTGSSPAEIAAARERALGLSPEARAKIVAAAYRLARGEFHPQRAASELFAIYNRALAASEPAAVAEAPAVPPAPPSRRERLREGVQRLGIYRPLSRLYWSRRRKRVLVTYDGYIASVFLYWEHALPRLEAATSRQWRLQPAGEVKLDDLYSFHTVISVRGISRQSLAILQAAKRFGARTIYDTDDDLLRIDEAFSDPAVPWRKVFGDARPEIEALLRAADAVKVYGEPALPSFRPYNPRVVAIRPYQILDREALPEAVAGRPVTVGFLGSYFKDDEWGPVAAAILRLLDEGHPLRFEFFGFLPRALAHRPEISHVPWRSSYPEYRATLATLGWDIGLAPLRDLHFNRAKNNAKYREYASAGIAGIYSDAEIHRTTIVHRETGLLVPQESAEAWAEAILELATDVELRRSIQRNAFADVRASYRIEDYVAKVAALVEEPLPPAGCG
ncbi:MAG: hypothetical protein QOF89_5221 [Acidobacteriota bacterium]|jgi:glycosyltransferase involved in cell wall biosynthesis|nr:hypothetical protein [Acidobacteriota bacterium]